MAGNIIYQKKCEITGETFIIKRLYTPNSDFHYVVDGMAWLNEGEVLDMITSLKNNITSMVSISNPQAVQIECKISRCYHNANGNVCTTKPAISLNEDNKFSCWSYGEEECIPF